MRIGISVFGSAPGKTKGGGIRVYVKNLIESLVVIDNENEYHIFVSKQSKKDYISLQKKNFHFHICPLPENTFTRLLFDQVILPVYLLRYKLDVIHFPISRASFFCLKRAVITVHDLMYKYYAKEMPGYIPLYKSIYFNMNLKIALKKVKAVIVDSHYTSSEIQKNFVVDKAKLNVIHLGADHIANNEIQNKKFRDFGKYILTVKSTVPHKNLRAVFESFMFVKQKYSLPHKLVVAGVQGFAFDEFAGMIKEKKMEEEVIFLNDVTDEELPALYAGADLFLFLSLNEGFGLPVLEAMKAEVPVICSNRASLPEVAGDAAIIVDPLDIKRIGESTNEIISDKKLRDELIKKGFKRASEFSWDETGKETLKVYKKFF